VPVGWVLFYYFFEVLMGVKQIGRLTIYIQMHKFCVLLSTNWNSIAHHSHVLVVELLSALVAAISGLNFDHSLQKGWVVEVIVYCALKR
jgi:hypothetical protein